MHVSMIVALAISLLVLFLALRMAWNVWSLARAPRRVFSSEWDRIIRHVLPPYARWSVEVQRHFQQKVQQFLAHKHFVGSAGLTTTEEMRVTIAAFACLLVMKQPLKMLPYARIKLVQVYPAELVVRNGLPDVSGKSSLVWGSLWRRRKFGRVLLAWSEAEKMVYDFNQGQNVEMNKWVYMDGPNKDSREAASAVLLHSRGAFGSWAAVTTSETELTSSDLWHEARIWQAQFGALSPAEFFSAATEHFFDRPKQLQKSFPDVYQRFQNHYQVDPSVWSKVPDEQ